MGPSPFIRDLYNGKYGKILSKVVQNTYISSTKDLPQLGSALGTITLYEQIGKSGKLTPEKTEKITSLLKSDNPIQKAAGALATMEIAYSIHGPRIYAKQIRTTPDKEELLKKLGNAVVPLLYAEKPQLQFAASWAFAWLGTNVLWSPKNSPDVLSQLLTIWRESTVPELRRQATWAISDLPIIDRELNPFPKTDQKLIEFIENWGSIKKALSKGEYNRKESRIARARRIVEFSNKASLIIGFYLKKPWTDEVLAKLVAEILEGKSQWRNGTLLLKELGEPGRKQLEKLKKVQKNSSK